MSGIAGGSSLAAAQAEYVALFEDVFSNTQNMAYMHDLAVRTVPVDGKSLVIPVVASFPRWRQWIAGKQDKSLRAFSQTINVVSYERTVGLKRLDVDADKTGAVNDILRAFLSDNKRGLDDLLTAKVIANTWTGYDGVTLLNSSHPYSNSTGNNITTSALGHEVVRSLKSTMGLFTDEDGTPLAINPTHLYYGPSNERLAREILDANARYVALNASGAEATSSVVATTAIPNVFQGEMTGVKIPWLGAQWFMMDLGKPGLMPFIRAVFREIEPITTDTNGMTDHDRFHKDKRYYSLEGDFEFGCGLWQLIAGRVAA